MTKSFVVRVRLQPNGKLSGRASCPSVVDLVGQTQQGLLVPDKDDGAVVPHDLVAEDPDGGVVEARVRPVDARLAAAETGAAAGQVVRGVVLHIDAQAVTAGAGSLMGLRDHCSTYSRQALSLLSSHYK